MLRRTQPTCDRAALDMTWKQCERQGFAVGDLVLAVMPSSPEATMVTLDTGTMIIADMTANKLATEYDPLRHIHLGPTGPSPTTSGGR